MVSAAAYPTMVRIEAALLVLMAILLGFLNYQVGVIQYPGYDFGPAADGAWRLAQGQIPFRDFELSFPVAMIAPLAWLSSAIGHKYSNAALMGSVWGGLVFLASYSGLRLLGAPLLATIAVALSFWTANTFYYGFIWHTPMAYGVVVLWLLGGLLVLCNPRGDARRFGISLFCLSTALGVLSKPNVGWPVAFAGTFGPVFWGLLVKSDRPSSFVLASASVAGLLGAVIFSWNMLSMYLVDQIRFFVTAGASRKMFTLVSDSPVAHSPYGSIPWIHEVAATYQPLFFHVTVFSLLLFLVYQGSSSRHPQPFPRKSLALVLMAGAVISIFFGATLSADALLPPIIALGTCMFSFLVAEKKIYSMVSSGTARPSGYVVSILVLLTCLIYPTKLLVEQGLERERVRGAGRWLFWSPPAITGPGDGFFYGSTIGKGLLKFHSEMAPFEMLDRNLFYGPRLEHAYGHTGRKSPVQLPLWWDPKVSFKEADAALAISFDKADFYGAVFFRRSANWDFHNLLPANIQEKIRKDFPFECRLDHAIVLLRSEAMLPKAVKCQQAGRALLAITPIPRLRQLGDQNGHYSQVA